jgi:hypothetical protein
VSLLAPTKLQTYLSCSCLLRPSSSTHSMFNKPLPPNLLVIPPTPTGSTNVSPTSPTGPTDPTSPYRRQPSYGEAIRAVDLVQLKLSQPPKRTPVSSGNSFKSLANSLRLALTKRFVKRESVMPKFEVVYPESFNRKHRRSSSDPFSSAVVNDLPKGVLDCVLEESSPLSARLRTVQSESCLSPHGSSKSSIDFFLLPSDSISSVDSLESSQSTMSELALAEALRPTDPNVPRSIAQSPPVVRSLSSSNFGTDCRPTNTSTSASDPRNSVTGSCPSRLPFPSAISGSAESSSFLEEDSVHRLGQSNGSNTLSPSRIQNNIQRRSSDSDLSITPKGLLWMQKF